MSSRRLRKQVYWILPALLAGCATTETPREAPAETDGGEALAPRDGNLGELTPDIVYNILLGEIALQRRQLDLAYTHQLEGAVLAGDAKAAERATRIAIHQQDYPKALLAAERWVEIAPEDLQAQMMMVLVAMRAQQADRVLVHLQKIVTISEAKKEDGFLHAVSTVAQAREHQMALDLMRQLVAGYPDDPRAGYALALTAVLASDYETAESEARRVLKSSPEMTKAYILLARILISKQDKTGAKTVLQTAVARFPKHAALNTAYGRLLVELNETDQAYVQFQRMRRLLPETPEILLSLGILAIQLDRLDEARDYLQEMLRLNRGTDEAAFYLGRIEEREKKPDAAIAWYRKVITDGTLRLDAQARIARLLAERGDLEQARELMSELRREMPERSVDIYLLEGGLLQDNASPEMVREHYDTALKAHPENSELLYARGLFASLHGQLAEAEQDLRKIIQQDSNHADALNALGYTLADQTDRYQEALGYIERALALQPESPAVLDSMGWVQYRLGNNQEALRYLREAYGKLPDVEIASHLGEVLWVTGSREEARKVWNQAVAEDPDNQYLLRTIRRLDK